MMITDNKRRSNSPLEKELTLRFSRLKDADAMQAPPFPADEQLHPKTPSHRHWALTGSVAAAVLVAVGVALYSPQPTEDPADLYLAIMQHNVLTTDPFLQASPGVLPELDLLPALYELNFSDGSTE